MITILFISDDLRAAELVIALQSHCRAKIRLAADFDEGLKEVFDNRPAVVLIQNDISGISGETVARHIKTLLRADAPRIVLIHSTPLKLQGGKKWYDDTLDLSLSPSDMVESFRSQLAACRAGLWIEEAPAATTEELEPVPSAGPSVEEPSPEPAVTAPEFELFDWEVTPQAPAAGVPEPPPVVSPAPKVTAPLSIQPPVPSAEPTVERSDEVIQPSVPAGVASPVHPPAATPVAHDVKGELPVAPQPSGGLAPPPRPEGAMARQVPSVSDFNAETFEDAPPAWLATAEDAEHKASRTPLIWSLAILAAVVVVVIGYLVFNGRGRPQPPAAGQPATPAPAASSVSVPPQVSAQPSRRDTVSPPPATSEPRRLPPFVPVAGRDAAFAKANPGWERYLGKGREYRIFRENGRIRAFQIIARDAATIPESSLASALKELTGSPEKSVASRGGKGGYVAERGRTAGNGEVVVYRKKEGAIKGIVITLP